jgi:hypothetical protein
MCAIITNASKLKVTYITGFNPLSDDADDVCGEEMKVLQEDIYAMKDEHINGSDFMLPFVPICAFNVVEAPTFVTCSKHGSITSQLITNMLSKMEDFCLFNHSDGINPFLICDGHVSRFEEPSLEYTLDSTRHWTCCTIVPYGTSLW